MTRRFCAAFVVPALLAACSSPPAEEADTRDKPDLLLFTSLPIFWSEGAIGDILSGDAKAHWARTALEQRYGIVPVDTLTALPADAPLLMAQPRALTPEENVALDDHVRAGGRVVMIVDPMLDAHSDYGLGDRRRPVAIAMLSPILARWGLSLEADGRGAYGAQWRSRSFPVEDGGRFRLTGKGHESTCVIAAEGLVARCNVGAGQAVLLGDATFLADGENAGPDGAGLLFDLIRAAQDPSSGL